MDKKIFVVRKGKLGAKIEVSKSGIELLITNNGYQWFGGKIKPDILDMLVEVIQKYKKEIER